MIFFGSKNIFDKLFFAFLLCALFVVGFHIGKEKSEDKNESVTIFVRVEKLKGNPKENDTVLIDGKYECRFVSLKNGEVSLLSEGSFEESGFLFYGCKYLSKNQPIKALGDWGYFEGRISNIEKKSFD